MDYGFVCILDALGTKGSWIQEPHDSFITKIKSFNKDLLTYMNSYNKSQFGKLEIYSFSDTIFVIYKCPIEEGKEPRLLIPIFAKVIAAAFSYALTKKLFLRGAISQGNFYQDENIFVGPAIDDAAAYFEKTDWIGVICTPSTSYASEFAILVGDSIIKKSNQYLIKYDVPMHNQVCENLYSINWPAWFNDLPDTSKPSMSRAYLCGLISENPIPSQATSKYIHTLEFYDYCTSQKVNTSIPQQSELENSSTHKA